MKYLAIVGVLAASPALAEPDCLDYTSATLFAQDGHAVVCTGDDKTCTVFADAKAKPAKVARPAEPNPDAATFKADGGKLSVCADARCVPLGPKLAAVVAPRKADPHVGPVTRDLALVVVDDAVWNVAKDTQMKLTPPPHADSSSPVLAVAGNALVAAWRNCPDDLNCSGKATVIDADGKTVGAAFPDGQIVVLDAHHAAVVGAHGKKLTAIDTDTRKQLGQVTVVSAGRDGLMEAFSAARLDDTTVGVVWRGNSAPWKLSWVKVPPGKAPSVSGTRSVKICEP
jgi:hypothetical protein